MPEIQTIEIFSEWPDEANTVCRARHKDTRALIASSAVLDAPDPSGVVYLPQFTDLPADEYFFTHETSTGQLMTYGYATVTLTTATFRLHGVRAAELPATAVALADVADDVTNTFAQVEEATTLEILQAVTNVDEDLASVKEDTSSILTKLSAAFSTLVTNLTAMITGSGGTAAFTEVALANAPAGGGGGSGTATLEKQNEILGRLSGTTIEVTSPIREGGHLTLFDGDNYVGAFVISLPVSDPGESLKTFLESCSSVLFGAGRYTNKNEITGTVTIAGITHSSDITYLPITIPAVAAKADRGYTYHIKGVDDDGEHVRVQGSLTLLAERISPA